MNAVEFCSTLRHHGFDFASGVPCSILKGIILHLESRTDICYVPATREDEAIGIATGAYLAGRQPVVLMQNSGLGNVVNALTSMVLLYRIPLLLVISGRGFRIEDAPEHSIIGQVMTKLLETIGVQYEIVSREDPVAAVSAAARNISENGSATALILPKGTIE